jgi:hypothetical protein
MQTFDPYTQNIIKEFLSEGKGSGMGMKVDKKASQSNIPVGADPYQQLTWWNYAQTVEKMLEGMTAGLVSDALRGGSSFLNRGLQTIGGGQGLLAAAGQGLEKAGSGVAKVVDVAGKPVEYAVKQALRTTLAKAYLGADVDPIAGIGGMFEKELASYNIEVPDAVKNYYNELKNMAGKVLDPANLGFEPNLFASGRMGPIGKYQATRLSRLAMAGENPLTLSLKSFGAENAADTIRRSYTDTAPYAETAGGFLQKGKQLGIYK